VTNDEITKLVTYELGLQDNTAFSEASFVATWIYNGTLDLLSRARPVVRCINLNVNAGTDQYTLDHKILTLVDVESGARPRAARAADVTAYSFVLVRSDVLLVRPTPSEDGSVQVWAVLRPQKMVNPTDDLGTEAFGAIPDEFQDAVVTYALWKGSRYADDQSGQQGELYRIQYEGADGRSGRLGQIKTLVNKRGTASLARTRVDLAAQAPSGYFSG